MIVDIHLNERELAILESGGYLEVRMPDGLSILFVHKEDRPFERDVDVEDDDV